MRFKKLGNYIVYDNGYVYSLKLNKFLSTKPDNYGYICYQLRIDGKIFRCKAHQLVAILFIPKPESNEQLIINHKDGDKTNNKYTNLEWCTYYQNNQHARQTGLNNIAKSNSKRWEDPTFREKTSRNISSGLKGISAWKKNPRFRYEIIDANGREYTRQDLCKVFNFAQSTVDNLIRKYTEGKIHKKFIEFGIIVKDIKKRESQQTIESIVE